MSQLLPCWLRSGGAVVRGCEKRGMVGEGEGELWFRVCEGERVVMEGNWGWFLCREDEDFRVAAILALAGGRENKKKNSKGEGLCLGEHQREGKTKKLALGLCG